MRSLVTPFISLRRFACLAASAGDEVEDEYDERYHQQQMDEAAGNVEAESEQPQDQNNYEDGPEHFIPLAK
jgi:hypothetical protein